MSSGNALAEWVLFLALAFVALAGAAMMILTMSMYRAGLFLMVSFLALAGMFFLLQAEMLAIIQIMMNVGGMLVMILFMVMLMIDPGGEMMWDMKRQMELPGPGAFSMSMPRGAPPAEDQAAPAPAVQPGAVWTCPMHPEVRAHAPGRCPKCGMDLVPAETAPPAAAASADASYTCPMHPEVVSDAPGRCPKCGMDLVPAAEPAQPPTPEHGAMAMEHGAMEMSGAHEGSGMSPAAHYQMMVGMAMSTEQLPWALGIGTLSGLALAALVLWTRWPLASVRPAGDAAGAVGALLLSRYMMAFEGAALLIVSGIAGAVILGRREGVAPASAAGAAAGGAPSPEHGGLRMHEPSSHITGDPSPGGGGGTGTVWTCPMHPEVRQDTPGRCPKCGMDLVPAESLGTGGAAHG